MSSAVPGTRAPAPRAFPEDALPQTRPFLDRLVVETVFRPIRDGSAVSETVARIGQAIALGLLRPGEQLPPEARLAEDLGISTTTLRTALAILREAGHLQTVRGRGGGTFVVAQAPGSIDAPGRELPSEAELLDFADYRAAVECGAAGLAAERATPAQIHYLQALVARMSAAADFDEWGQTDTLFHLAVADASGSRRLLAEVTSLRGDAHRFSLSVPEPRSTFDLSNDEHRTIVNAIAAGRPDRARQAVAEHVRSAVALWLGLGLVSERTQPEGGRRARAPRTDGRE